MIKLYILLLNLVALATLVVYHFLGGETAWVAFAITNIAFSFADYPSYNWSVKVQWSNDCIPDNQLYEPYRIIQYILGVGLGIQLFIWYGWTTVLAFAVWHFTFNNDNLFYLWLAIFNFFKQSRKAWIEEIWDDKCSWAFFTPVGIYYWYKAGNTNTIIKGKVIVWQSAIGIILSFGLLIYFSK